MIYAVSEIGDMVDFLKAIPNISLEQYEWGMSVPKTKLMAIDYTRARYLSDEEVAMKKGEKLDEKQMNDLGVPIFE